MLIYPERWKNLRGRYEEDRPGRVLALDGGGIRGLIIWGLSKKIEGLVVEKIVRRHFASISITLPALRTYTLARNET